MTVLVIVPSTARRDELFAVARETLHPTWWQWLAFLTVAALDPERFDREPWLWLDGDRCRLLPAPTPTAAKPPQSR